MLTFGTRSGTRQGVESHVFRVETQRDLSTWSRILVQTAHTSAVLVKEVSCGKPSFLEEKDLQDTEVYNLLCNRNTSINSSDMADYKDIPDKKLLLRLTS